MFILNIHLFLRFRASILDYFLLFLLNVVLAYNKDLKMTHRAGECLRLRAGPDCSCKFVSWVPGTHTGKNVTAF